MLKELQFKGEVVVITGGGQGIGKACAEALAELGAALVIAERNGAQLEATAAELRKTGVECVPVVTDVTREADVAALARMVDDRWGRAKAIVNNAGNNFRTPLGELPTEKWREIMSVNLDGVFLGTRAGVAAMKASGGGSIVNIGSIAGYVGTRGGAAYGASKGGVRALTKQAALSCAQNGYKVRVNAIHPGYVWTPMVARKAAQDFPTIEAARTAFAAMNPMGLIGDPDDVAWAVVYLASDEARLVTGADLVIDGGRLIR